VFGNSGIFWLIVGTMQVEVINKLCGLSPRPNYMDDHRFLIKLVPTFADRECHIVSVTDPHGHILIFLDRSCYFSMLGGSLSPQHGASWDRG
jgi:hypothetical protein